jgi:hypothetical protein
MGSKTFLDGEYGYPVKKHLYWLVQKTTILKENNKNTQLYGFA